MRISLPLALLLLPACRSLYEDAKKPLPDPDLENSEIARAQFDDIPAPEGFLLRTESLESYAYQCGTFRQGRLFYSGAAPPARVADYLRERLPQHGWEPVTEGIEKTTRHLEFRKGGTALLCDLSQSAKSAGGTTSLLIRVEPAAGLLPVSESK